MMENTWTQRGLGGNYNEGAFQRKSADSDCYSAAESPNMAVTSAPSAMSPRAQCAGSARRSQLSTVARLSSNARARYAEDVSRWDGDEFGRFRFGVTRDASGMFPERDAHMSVCECPHSQVTLRISILIVIII